MSALEIVRAGPSGGDGTWLAGGTTLVDLMKLGVVAPARLVDILDMPGLGGIEVTDEGVTVGALATMSEVAAHPAIRTRWPAVASALDQSASPQIRNVATVGGNLLQRTRCTYFRDARSACNRRAPGTGCAAIGGRSRELAVLGTSAHCIASYPGDLAIALVAAGATLTVAAPDGSRRTLPVEALHRAPGDRPDVETVLGPGELIVSVALPAAAWSGSAYVKIRDRASYAFALASAAVSLALDGRRVVDARIALGGVATVPWRCREAEAALVGGPLTRAAVEAAAAAELEGAVADEERAFKIELARRTLLRAVAAAARQAGVDDLA